MIRNTVFQLFCLCFLCIPLLIGIYVYRDAKRRNMNAALWTLIAILAPSFLGFLVYLLARSSHSDLKCPQCGASVTEQFAVCPHCGTRLKPACPGCGAAVEPDWAVCPHCARPLPDSFAGYTEPVRHRDRWIGKILLAVVLLPLLLLLTIYLVFLASGRVGAMNVTYLTPESYLEAKEAHWSPKEYDEVSLWLNGCLSDPGRAYVLRHEVMHQDQPVIQYLIYYPAADPQTRIVCDHDMGALGTKLSVDFRTDTEATDYTLCTVSIYSERAPKLKLSADGKPLEYELTDVSYGLTLMELLSVAE